MSLQHQELSRLLNTIIETKREYPGRDLDIKIIKERAARGNLEFAILRAKAVIEGQIQIMQMPKSITALIDSL